MGRPYYGLPYKVTIQLLTASGPNKGYPQVNPTVVADDIKLSIDGGTPQSLNNTPTVKPANSTCVEVVLDGDEMLGGRLDLHCSDQTPTKEWSDIVWRIEVEYLPVFDVVADGSNSATSFKTNLTEGTDGWWKDAFVSWPEGTALAGQVKKVSGYDSTTKFLTVSGGFTATPTTGQRAQLVNR